jgi:hypothetical protein
MKIIRNRKAVKEDAIVNLIYTVAEGIFLKGNEGKRWKLNSQILFQQLSIKRISFFCQTIF